MKEIPGGPTLSKQQQNYFCQIWSNWLQSYEKSYLMMISDASDYGTIAEIHKRNCGFLPQTDEWFKSYVIRFRYILIIIFNFKKTNFFSKITHAWFVKPTWCFCSLNTALYWKNLFAFLLWGVCVCVCVCVYVYQYVYVSVCTSTL